MEMKTMMAAAGLTAATMAVAAGVATNNKKSRKVKKMVKKVTKGAERAVMDLDKMVGRYYH